jgi:transposase
VIDKCGGCVEKQKRIDLLERKMDLLKEENELLRLKQGGQEKEEEGEEQEQRAGCTGKEDEPGNTSTGEPPDNLSEPHPAQTGKAPGNEGNEVERKSKPGHGRRAWEAYEVEETIVCKDEKLGTGDCCPLQGCGGRLYDMKAPQMWIRFQSRPPVSASRYEQQVLRCSRCQERFAAKLPAGVPAEKYDATADAVMALMKYGAGVPWHRLAKLQELMGVPLPASTQFERCALVAEAARPIYEELQREASGGEVVHFDDTGIKILSCLKENQERGPEERKGLHTTGFVASHQERKTALYFSGRRHAGENLGELMRKRPAGLGPPIVMADAEAKNWTGAFEQVVAKCLQHGRRQFTEVEAEFPIQCKRVLEALAVVYRNEAATVEMSNGDRLLYHQQNSGPVLARLREWIKEQMDGREVEPNSGLGRAMRYMLKHWDGLTRFLEVEGSPLDNNLAERVLKRAVLHRKNSLFYKTQRGAVMGDILMSLIQTCALNKVNAFDYLVALVRNSGAVRANPSRWLPWQYKQEEERKAA